MLLPLTAAITGLGWSILVHLLRLPHSQRLAEVFDTASELSFRRL
jgi:hypothetical protein